MSNEFLQTNNDFLLRIDVRFLTSINNFPQGVWEDVSDCRVLLLILLTDDSEENDSSAADDTSEELEHSRMFSPSDLININGAGKLPQPSDTKHSKNKL